MKIQKANAGYQREVPWYNALQANNNIEFPAKG